MAFIDSLTPSSSRSGVAWTLPAVAALPLLLPACVVSNPDWIPPLSEDATGASDPSDSASDPSDSASSDGSTSAGTSAGTTSEESTVSDSSFTTNTGTDVSDLPDELDGLDAYKRRRPILLNTYALNPVNAEDPKVYDLPVRVVLNSSRADWEALEEDELRFVWDDEETILAHEVESWDEDSELALIWVMVPSVLPQTTETFYLYYDKDDLDPAPEMPLSWKKFTTVHHLSGDSSDSASGLDGAPWPPGAQPVESPGGRGVELFGDMWLQLAPNPAMTTNTGYVSLLFQSELSLDMSLFRGSHGDGDQLFDGPGVVSVFLSDGFVDATVGGELVGFNGAYAQLNGDLGWHHLAVSWDQNEELQQQVRIWLDGQPGSWNGFDAQIGGHSLEAEITVGATLEEMFFVGGLDELRQSASSRPNLYVQAEARSMLHADDDEWIEYSDEDELLDP